MSESAQVLIQRVTDTLYAPVRYSGIGSPEGVQTSEVGWVYRDTTYGTGLWYKKTGSGNTGWKAMGGTLFSNTTQTGNIGASAYTLQTNTIYGGTLKDDGDAVEFFYNGQLLTPGVRSFRLAWAGSTVVSVDSNLTANVIFTITGKIIRSSATQVRLAGGIHYSATSELLAPTYAAFNGTIASTQANDNILLLTGTAGTDNSVLKYCGMGYLRPAT